MAGEGQDDQKHDPTLLCMLAAGGGDWEMTREGSSGRQGRLARARAKTRSAAMNAKQQQHHHSKPGQDGRRRGRRSRRRGLPSHLEMKMEHRKTE